MLLILQGFPVISDSLINKMQRCARVNKTHNEQNGSKIDAGHFPLARFGFSTKIHQSFMFKKNLLKHRPLKCNPRFSKRARGFSLEVFPLPVAQTLQCSAELKHLATASLSWLFLMLLLYIKHFYTCPKKISALPQRRICNYFIFI